MVRDATLKKCGLRWGSNPHADISFTVIDKKPSRDRVTSKPKDDGFTFVDLEFSGFCGVPITAINKGMIGCREVSV